jgi:prolyl-tRNA synthetase
VEYAGKVEAHLADKCVLVGDAFSLADLVVALAFSCADLSMPTVTDKWMKACLMQLQKCGVTIEMPAAATPEAAAAVAAPTAAVSSMADAAAVVPSDNAVLAALQLHGIEHEVQDHVTCMTAEELVANVPLPAGHTHTKNLFLKDKKHGLYLITVATDKVVNTKDLGKLLNLSGKTNFRLADADILDSVLHVKPGCVGPLAVFGASEPVTLVLDVGLKTAIKIHSHPLRNDQSVALTPPALEAICQKMNVVPVWLEFGVVGATPAAAATPAVVPKAAPKDKAAAASASEAPAAAVNKDKKTGKKGETLLALQWKKSENFPMWYSDVIVLSEMISYYDISGCYILRPWSYKMWELIQEWFNGEIQKLGVENSYFPMFVSQDRLEKEKDHVEGFAPEVAWVTRSGDGELAKPIAVRPTSETIMYPAYSDWIKSHRDLPLKLNQWNNVVRWEFKYPTPFLRTREFLWQEGHTAHSTTEEAEEMVMKALGLYREVYEGLLAVPVVPGYKTEKEKFAGGYRTTTVEAYIAGSGRAIQGATSHHLGQNFGKMFDITFQDEKGETQTAWQTSWGLTTRTIGVMVMVHGDDTGLVLPPRIAPLQAVIVPIYSKSFTSETADPYCESIRKDLVDHGIRAKYDSRQMYNPGWKYNHWEQKGVPVRIEVGPRDVTNQSARIVYRYNGEKKDMSVDGLGVALLAAMVEIQANMLKTATAARDEHLVQITEWKDFVPNLEKNNLILTPWIGGEHTDWEEWVKAKSREESLANLGLDAEDEKTATSVAAKTLCIPFAQPDLPAGTKCIASGKDATCWIMWGRSY